MNGYGPFMGNQFINFNELTVKIKLLEEEILKKYLELIETKLSFYQTNNNMNNQQFFYNIMYQIKFLNNNIDNQKKLKNLNFDYFMEEISKLMNKIR